MTGSPLDLHNHYQRLAFRIQKVVPHDLQQKFVEAVEGVDAATLAEMQLPFELGEQQSTAQPVPVVTAQECDRFLTTTEWAETQVHVVLKAVQNVNSLASVQGDLHFAYVSHIRFQGHKAVLLEGKQLGGYKQSKEIAMLLASDRRNLNMLMMEQLLIIARDCAPWAEYDLFAVVAEFRKTRRVRNLRGRRKDKGTNRRKTDVSDAEVPSDLESVDDEALSDNLSDVSHLGSDSGSSSSSGSNSSSTTDGGSFGMRW